MFLRDFPLSIPEWDFPKKRADAFLDQLKSLNKKTRKVTVLHGKTTPPKTNGWIPKNYGLDKVIPLKYGIFLVC